MRFQDIKEESMDIEAFLSHGAILQLNEKEFLIGEGLFEKANNLKSKKIGFYHPDFFLKEPHPWWQPKRCYRISLETLEQIFKTFGEQTSQKNRFRPAFWRGLFNVEKMQFKKVFQSIQKGISRRHFIKIVPAFFESHTRKFFLKQSLYAFFYESQDKDLPKLHEGFLYGAWDSHEGFLGFTPEVLFSVKGSCIQTMALAGTERKSVRHSMKEDSKLLKEQALVVEGIEWSLKDLVDWESKIFLEVFFGNLRHLCTQMKGSFKEKFCWETVIKRLHPTPALSGFPKHSSQAWLENHPIQKNRRYFGAPFGFYNGRDEGLCVVSIRGLEWSSKGFRIGSGAGIIQESKLNKEWVEIHDKRNQIKELFF